jgi:predicted AAA+ superfamily ATPase
MEVFGDQGVIFFDEIQNIFGWEKFVGRLFNSGYKIFITGSSANLLSRELATALTGRHLKTELYPFSFREFLQYFKVAYQNLHQTATRAKIKRYFNLYLEYGGFPEIVISRDKNELKQLYQDVIIKDLLVRFKIKEVKAFRE